MATKPIFFSKLAKHRIQRGRRHKGSATLKAKKFANNPELFKRKEPSHAQTLRQPACADDGADEPV